MRATVRCGVAYDRRETHPAVACIAAPLLDQRRQVIAAISISGSADRFNPDAVAERLRRTARTASLALAATNAVPAAA